MDPQKKKYIFENASTKSVVEIARDLDLREKKVKRFLERERSAGRTGVPAVSFAMSRRTTAFCLFALFCLGFFAYGAVVKGDFIWDDPNLVGNNVAIKDISRAGRIFTQDVEAGAGGATRFYRPLLTLSFMVDYARVGLDPSGYHITNILLHVFAAWALFWFLGVLFKDLRLALLAAVFFVVHPVHTEAVSYISGRSDPLVLIFFLTAFVFYVKSVRRPSLWADLGLGMAYACALLSRESALVFLVLALAGVHGILREKVRGRSIVILIAVTAAYGVVRARVFQGAFPMPEALPFAQRWPGAFVAVVHYLRLLIWPFDLHMEYGMPVFSPLHPKVLAGVFLLGGLAGGVVWSRRRDPIVAFALAWFLIGLAPVLNFIPLNAYMAEHWLYLPSVGFVLLLALFVRRLSAGPAGVLAARALAAGLLLFFLALTIRQNIAYWRVPKLFYETTLKFAPQSSRLMTNLGHVYQGEGRLEEAEALYRKAIAIDPRHEIRAYSGLGAVYQRMGRNEEAIAVTRAGIAAAPGFAELYSNLGAVYEREGRTDEALAAFRKAVALYPDSAVAQMNLGVLLSRREDAVVDAIACFRKAIVLNPHFPEAYHNLANLYMRLQSPAEAVELYKKALALRPQYAAARHNLAAAQGLAQASETR